jgi:hypothetical protein
MCAIVLSSDDDDTDVDHHIQELVEKCTSKNDDGNEVTVFVFCSPVG